MTPGWKASFAASSAMLWKRWDQFNVVDMNTFAAFTSSTSLKYGATVDYTISYTYFDGSMTTASNPPTT